MKRLLCRCYTGLLAANVFACVCPPAFGAQEPGPGPASVAELRQKLADHLSQQKFAHAIWGVKIVSLATGKTLFEHNPQKLLSPASNSKLYTVAMVLDRLGPDYRIKTSLYAREKPDPAGALHGDLILYGRGDPTINARLHGGDIYKGLEPLVFALTNAGVRHVAGDLVADDSYFHGPEFGSGWEWGDMENYYGAEISSLTINDNTLQVTVKPGARVGAPCEVYIASGGNYLAISNRTETVETNGTRKVTLFRVPDRNILYVSGKLPLEGKAFSDEMTVHNPAGLFGLLFREMLGRHGIKASGHLRTRNWLDRQVDPIDSANMVELGSIESLPLREIAREMQKRSQNLYADLLLAHVGELKRTPGTAADQTSEELGVQELNRFLAEVGIPKMETFFEEGSGLSRDNQTTPNATVALLEFMSRHKCAGAYLEALPIAGVDGTLRNRMKDTVAASNVRAKTGSLRWAASLSGYVTTAAGERLAFSIMLNRYQNADPGRPTRAEIDVIPVLLAGLKAHSE
jgi:serine-type D-Ala-D-Ala carboxypeptidase/endopeptidase (penicillin-binding protein 4)